MTTLSVMKARIAQELRRDDLTTEIANAIPTAIAFYQYEKFATFNNTSLVSAPVSDSETGNAWMTTAEEMIRNRAKAVLYSGTIKDPDKGRMYYDLATASHDQLKIPSTAQTETSGTTAGTRGRMKARIANEIGRGDLTTEIANAIDAAIAYFQYERFQTFNVSSLQAAPASDSEANNPWMTTAERMIRTFAKAELYAGPLRQPDQGKVLFELANQARDQLKISSVFQTELSSTTAGTLGRMKARIANEIGRGDLTTDVANAISTAISYYQNERFYFNETRDITWNTVANQDIYTSADVANFANLIKIDYLFAYIGGQPYAILPLFPKAMEWSHLSTGDPIGQPLRFLHYAESIRLYPTPDQAYSMRMAGVLSLAEPASDSVTGNNWMTKAEEMIRCRAKYELYSHIPAIANPVMAQTMKGLADDQFNQLRERTADLEKTSDYIVEPWGY